MFFGFGGWGKGECGIDLDCALWRWIKSGAVEEVRTIFSASFARRRESRWDFPCRNQFGSCRRAGAYLVPRSFILHSRRACWIVRLRRACWSEDDGGGWQWCERTCFVPGVVVKWIARSSLAMTLWAGRRVFDKVWRCMDYRVKPGNDGRVWAQFTAKDLTLCREDM